MGIDDSNEIIQRERSLPPVPRSASGDLQTSMASMIEQIERLSGKVGDPSSRAIRLYDLENGIVSRYFSPQSATKSKKPGSGGSRILKAPRNLQYEHLIFAIRLTWENVEEDYAYVEIWCAEDSTVIDDARKVGIATKPLEEWTHNGISTRINYTYWIRAVGWDGAVSPWCPPQGQGGLIVPAPIDKTIEEILDLLIGNLTEDHLYQELIKRIDLIDGPPDLIGSVAERLNILRGQTAALIQALEERLESADEAMARQISTLFSQVRDNAAAIQTEKTTRATADSAMASSITQLQASVASANAAISSEASTRASKDEALTSRIDLAFSRIGETNAAIQTEQTARANADTALSSNVTTLQTKVNTNTASIQQAMTSINGIEAMYFLKTDVNGYVAGYGLRNTGSTSNFIVLADKFMIVAPGQTPKVPFVVGRVGASNTWGVGIDGGLVVNGTIIARHLDANSVTAEKIGAGQISAGHISAKSIKSEHLESKSIKSEHLESKSIKSEHLSAGVITADMIKAVGIQADWIKTGTLDANLIRQNGIPLSKIAAGVINNVRSGSGSVYISASATDDVFVWVSWHGQRQTRRVGDTHRVEAASVSISGKLSKTFSYPAVDGGGYADTPTGTWMDVVKGPSTISISSSGLNNFQNRIVCIAVKNS